MSGTIPSLPLSQGASSLTGATGGTPAVRAAAAPSSTNTATSSGEAVTVSADAITTTQLLGAARNANGIDQAAVQQLRTAIQNGTYNVSPESLAGAMGNALKEASS